MSFVNSMSAQGHTLEKNPDLEKNGESVMADKSIRNARDALARGAGR